MPEVKIRKMLVSVEEIFHEGGPVASEPLRKAACLAIIENPYAGRYESHGALWHVPGGYSMREMIKDSNAIVPSTKKVGAPGARLDVPMTHTNASYVRSHFDAMEVGVHDAPRANELVLALVMSTGARVHNRAGGLDANDIVGEDGLR